MSTGDGPGPPRRAPWVTPRFEVIDAGGAKVIAAYGQTTTGDDDAGSVS